MSQFMLHNISSDAQLRLHTLSQYLASIAHTITIFSLDCTSYHNIQSQSLLPSQFEEHHFQGLRFFLSIYEKLPFDSAKLGFRELDS